MDKKIHMSLSLLLFKYWQIMVLPIPDNMYGVSDLPDWAIQGFLITKVGYPGNENIQNLMFNLNQSGCVRVENFQRLWVASLKVARRCAGNLESTARQPPVMRPFT